MKLSNRVILLVAPVILLSALVSSYIIYSIQKVTLIKREDSYIQLQMEKLAGQFQQANIFLNSYAYTLSKSDVLQDYLVNHNNPYRERVLFNRLDETAEVLSHGYKGDASMAILDGKQNLLYYTENKYYESSGVVDPKVLEYISRSFNEREAFSHTGFIYNSSGQSILLQYEVVDKRTGTHPLSFDSKNVFFVVVSVSLEAFNEIKHDIEFDTHSVITFADKPIYLDIPLAQTIELLPHFYAVLSPAEYLMWNKVDKVWLELAFSFGVAAFFTITLIILVLYRYVLRPVSRLDKQLNELESNQRDNIEKLETNDEIGRLSARFFDMYEELNVIYKKTKRLAETDHLTQLANRHRFHELATRELISPSQFLWVVYVDLDNFKYVNDKYGHELGDNLLKVFSSHIKNACQKFSHDYNSPCFAARLSGDEFAILLSSNQEVKRLPDLLASELLKPISNLSSSWSNSFPVTASVGIAQYPQDGTDIAKLLSSADAAMYQAKRAGKNQYAYYSAALNIESQRRSQLERALRKSNVEEEFHLVFQPYMNNRSNEIEGLEVLLRWEAEGIGPIPPKEFIPIAEQAGLFDKIDRWVFANATAEYHQLRNIFGKDIVLSVNLSSAELNSIEMANYIHEQATLHSVKPECIEIEITETFAAEQQGTALLDELSKRGYRLAIDDFGSGYTSLTQLVQYPVQKIKFDREFLVTLMNTNNGHVIKPIIELCHAQNKTVTAEGIEHNMMHEWLSAYRCDYMQGYLFGKPMTKEQLSLWWQSANDDSRFDASMVSSIRVSRT
ncbi:MULTISPECIES: EAL domain-containing protein [Vibrio]|uniref:EAL domain-containing protein n=1 Tax=Vibrio TaxID=662 RepID=UPI001CDC8DB1|nr:MULTISPECIES: EAL domain-containing protein [Vibrio]MCA2422274.1 EAL domain-containing protein [Vibrio alginolyticus]MCA2446913.1 EAL domain-containing protein [Vibrio alginolyticus]MDW2062892.1 EAL domain-containing protein [Vibrio sp. 1579]MDW2157267.1 EAL domain-containing protein [Vibrio sp. 1942]MDW2182917.1 EAL domain-containing protein [Vibrio sp. 1762]